MAANPIYQPRALLEIFKAAALYFAIVFSTGFVFGTVRVLWAVPRFGVRAAELMEQPLMLIVTILAARWIVRRDSIAVAALNSLGVGIFALGLLLVSELGVLLWLRGISVAEYIRGRDPISGTLYLLLLVVFAFMPWFVARTVRRVESATK
jgi:hypothetical protein